MLTVNIAEARIQPVPGKPPLQRFAKTWCVTRFHDQRFCTAPVSDYLNISWNDQIDIMDIDTNYYSGFSNNNLDQHQEISFSDSACDEKEKVEAMASIRNQKSESLDSAYEAESKLVKDHNSESTGYEFFFSNIFSLGNTFWQKPILSDEDNDNKKNMKGGKRNRNDIDFIVIIEHEDIRHHLYTKLDMSDFRNAPDKNFDISLSLRHVRTSYHNSYISSEKENLATVMSSSKKVERQGDPSFSEMFQGSIRLIVNYCDDIYGEGGCENRICGNVCHGDGPLETLFRKLFGSYSDSSQLLMKQHYKQQRIRKERHQMKRNNSLDHNKEEILFGSSHELQHLS